MPDLKLIYRSPYGRSGGEMMIHLDKFFPCGVSRFKELLRVVQISNNRPEAIRALRAYFVQRIPELRAELEAAVVEYHAKRQQAADANRRFQTRKYENGVMIPDDELRRLKTEVKGFRSDYRAAEVTAKKAKRGIKQFERLLLALERGV